MRYWFLTVGSWCRWFEQGWSARSRKVGLEALHHPTARGLCLTALAYAFGFVRAALRRGRRARYRDARPRSEALVLPALGAELPTRSGTAVSRYGPAIVHLRPKMFQYRSL